MTSEVKVSVKMTYAELAEMVAGVALPGTNGRSMKLLEFGPRGGSTPVDPEDGGVFFLWRVEEAPDGE